MITCEQIRERLGEHLPAAAAQHLEGCPRCREELAEIRALQAHLRPDSPGPSDAQMLADVRRRVLSRLARRPWTGRLRWAAAGGLAAVLAAAVLWPGRPPGPLPAPITLAAPKAPDIAFTPRNRKIAPPPQKKEKIESKSRPAVQVARAAGPDEDLLVELESSNPDVLIYWLMEPAGD